MTQPEDGQLTPAEFRDFLQIDTQRLRVWVEGGLFGDDHRRTGRGNARRFSRLDAVVGRVVREIMDLTMARSLAIAKEGVLNEVIRALPEALAREGAIINTLTGEVNPVVWLILSWDRRKADWHLTREHGGDTGYPLRTINDGRPGWHEMSERRPGEAVILIPLWELVREVDDFFEKRGVAV